MTGARQAARARHVATVAAATKAAAAHKSKIAALRAQIKNATDKKAKQALQKQLKLAKKGLHGARVQRRHAHLKLIASHRKLIKQHQSTLKQLAKKLKNKKLSAAQTAKLQAKVDTIKKSLTKVCVS